MTAIRELDRETIDRIAAGEVIERPASAVKELVENSLDADADRIDVAIEAGGTEGMRVRDDGVGMTESELRLAVREHTTSKIDDVTDIESGIGTLGFRGEALYAIGAISRTTITSRPRPDRTDVEATDAGTRLRIEGGEITGVDPAGCPPGTVVEVEDLFYNMPARRKFLKTDATEFDHVNRVVTQYALANPDVAVSLTHDDREVFATQGDGNLRSAVLALYGRDVAEAMIEVSPDAPPAGPLEAVSGLVSHPETTRSGREYLSTFVNGRYVPSSTLREAILDAYGGQLASDRYPFAVLFVDVPTDGVDVNVHPRKLDVRFDDEAELKDAVCRVVRETLLDHGLVRSTAPRGQSAPEETDVTPEPPGEDAVGGAGTHHETASGIEDDATHDADAGSASASDRDADAGVDSDAAFDTNPELDPDLTTAERWGGSAIPDSTDQMADVESSVKPDSVGESQPPGHGSRQAAPETSDRPSPRPWQSDPAASDDEATDADPPGGIRGPTTQRTLDGDDATIEQSFETLPRLRVLGQLHDTYVVAETPDGMVLIDQHAADERINYERLRAEIDGDDISQSLADPVELALTAREAALFEEYADALADVGFRAERVDERTIAVRSVPAVLDATLDPDLLRDVLAAFVRSDAEDGDQPIDDVADALLADLACYPSITGNTSLREGSVVDLLSALDDCGNPYACPHGRPVIVEFDRQEIEGRFERDYPGHGGRRDGV